MGISSRSHKPNEWASKVNHTHLINDPFIQEYIKKCKFPISSSEIEKSDISLVQDLSENVSNPIKYILAVDGGYTSVEVKKNFPSSQIAFFQFGAVLFNSEDLDALSEKAFIFPEDMNKLHNLQRFKLAIPMKNVISDNQDSLKNSIRKVLHEFFMVIRDSSNFMETLAWLVFKDYDHHSCDKSYWLASNPNLEVGTGRIELKKEEMKSDFTFDSPNGLVYLTDVFRLHEAVDEEFGAGGILGYITRLIEQIIAIHFIKFIFKKKKDSLKDFLFIIDGPLSFSGQTANMHILVRDLCNFLRKNAFLHIVGLEKSGPFVDHAREICSPKNGEKLLKENQYMILSNQYIYKFIVPGDPDRMHYGSTSYYGSKLIFHSSDAQIIVLSVPVENKNIIKNPLPENFSGIEVILVNLQKLRCDMYDDAIVPIALANKLVSLANHPSKILLEKFATKGMGKLS
jgi:hypothetical protein